MGKRILVVDDEAKIRALIRKYAEFEGYSVEEAADGMDAVTVCREQDFDIVIMDVMMPGMDGFSACREIRKSKDVPVLMLSARGEEVDRVVGLGMGADDYLAKPFSPRELLARLRALIRRSRGAAAASEAEDYRFGPYRFDGAARRLLRDGADLGLSAAEFDLLRVFVERPNRVLTRDMLMDLLKGYERDPFDRTVDIRVGRLRRKIEPDPANPVYVRTVRGEGYLFNPRGVDG